MGWDRPLLQAVTDYLAQQCPPRHHERMPELAPQWDLSSIVVAAPSARMGRRLLDLLAGRAQHSSDRVALAPPHTVTIGALPRVLGRWTCPAANRFEVLLAWTIAMKSLPEDTAAVVPAAATVQGSGDWLSIARRLAALHDELAVEGSSMPGIARYCSKRPDRRDERRWSALARLEERYLSVLSSRGFTDPADLASMAVDAGDDVRTVLIVGAAEIPHAIAQFLRRLPVPVRFLVHAPYEERASFDELGSVRREVWLHRQLPIADDRIRQAELPRDQALEALAFLGDFADSVGPDECSIGLGDQRLLPFVKRAFAAAGVPIHAAYGNLLLQSRPMQVLGLLADYLTNRDAESLAALVRHPDLERLPRARSGMTNLLTPLDRYRKEHLPPELSSHPPDAPEARVNGKLDAVCKVAESLVGQLGEERRPLNRWAAPLADALATIYETLGTDPAASEVESGGPSLDMPTLLAESLQETANLLAEMASTSDDLAQAEPMGAADAIRLVRRLALDVAVPYPPRERAVEVLDWFEMHGDDAEIKVVLGMNEGAVPEPMTGDPFLPDSLRRDVGIPNSESRYARDAYLLTAMVQSTPHLALVAGRTSADGDPVSPSRLLLAVTGETLVRRAQRLFASSTDSPTRLSILFAPKATSSYSPVRPGSGPCPLQRLHVTAFRDYLACPYRFYLKHVLGLESVTDRAEEMDPALFGSLLHDAIGMFAQEDHSGADVGEVRHRLRRILDELANKRFGHSRLSTVDLQLTQAARRLDRFAAFHCAHRDKGWHVLAGGIERELMLDLDVDGEPCCIEGRIDRIEHNVASDEYLIVDYKSPDSRPDPDASHRRKEADSCNWTDLQLPLYRLMAMHQLLPPGSRVRVALLWLPPEDTEPDGMLVEAPWGEEDFVSAENCAREVIRKIRRGIFWPPAQEPPPFEDGLGGICMDRCAQRLMLHRNAEPPWSGA